MNIIETPAPISIDNLKKYFVDKSTTFVIDYKESQIKDVKILTYLSNLEIPCDIRLDNLETEEIHELVKAYLHSNMIVNVRSLEFFVMHVLKEAKGLMAVECHKTFINENKEIIDAWISKLDSLTLYNMYSIDNEDFKSFVKQFPESTENSLEGVNFVSLLKHSEFYDFYHKIDEDKLKFYSVYFQEYLFKGKNIYTYWANENNPLFLLTFGIAEGLVTNSDYIAAKNKDIQELVNVPSI